MVTGLEEVVQQLALTVLTDAAEAIMSDLIEAAPVSTGALRDSAYGPVIDEGALNATVGFDAPQADWTDQGTVPHDIDPVNAPLLTFFWPDGPNGPGVYNFAHVDHPGSTGSGWFTDLVDTWDDYVTAAADQVGTIE